MKKLVGFWGIILVLILILIAFITKTYLFNKNKSQKELNEKQEVLEQDVDYTKKLLEDESIKVKRVAESISSEVEIVVLKETGTMQIFHDKTPENNKYIEWIVDSNITLKVYYTAILTIDAEHIEVSYDKTLDVIKIIYDLDKIKVKSVNIDNILSETSNGIFGHKYLPKETSALTLLATDKIKEEISNDTSLNYLASITLEGYLTNLAYSLGVLNVSVVEK